MTDTLTVEQMDLVKRLKRRASEPGSKPQSKDISDRLDRLAAKLAEGRSDRIASRRKRADDFDAGRGIQPNASASCALLNQKLAVLKEDAATDAVLLIASARFELMDGIAEALVETVDPLIRRIESLQAQLEQRKYFGVWDNGDYKAHNMVTHSGSLWIALIDTAAQPGASDDWQLAAKRGRDGRDAR